MQPSINRESSISSQQSRITSRRPLFVRSRELGLLLLLVVIVILFRVLFPVSWEHFATFDNFSSVVRNMAFEGILALGMMLMLVGGTFDLSVGATASMIGVATGWLMKEAGWPVPVAVTAGFPRRPKCRSEPLPIR